MWETPNAYNLFDDGAIGCFHRMAVASILEVVLRTPCHHYQETYLLAVAWSLADYNNCRQYWNALQAVRVAGKHNDP